MSRAVRRSFGRSVLMMTIFTGYELQRERQSTILVLSYDIKHLSLFMRMTTNIKERGRANLMLCTTSSILFLQLHVGGMLFFY